MQKIQAALSNTIQFIKTDIWRIRLKNFPPAKAFLINYLRIILMTIREFTENQCPLRASALTFYSILSIVPVAAMAFGIAQGFGFETLLEKRLLENFPGQEDIIIQVIDFANKTLENTKGGLIAGIGVGILFWTVIKVLGHIELSLNAIWNIKTPRTIGRKLSDYLSIMIIGPILVIMAGSVNVFIQTQVIMITQKIALLGIFSPFIFFALKLLPYSLFWILFTMIYMIMPNGKVKFTSGLTAGIIAGTVYQLAQWGYIHFQIGVASYNKIYGSFAALPLFLVWVQVSWLIVLLGAAVSAAHQNAGIYEFEPDCRYASTIFKRLAALQISHLLIKNFSKGEKPLNVIEISDSLEIPLCLTEDIVKELAETGIISRIQTEKNGEWACQPAKDINLLTIKYIIDVLDKKGVNHIPLAQTEELKTLSDAMQIFNKTVEESPANRLLKDI